MTSLFDFTFEAIILHAKSLFLYTLLFALLFFDFALKWIRLKIKTYKIRRKGLQMKTNETKEPIVLIGGDFSVELPYNVLISTRIYLKDLAKKSPDAEYFEVYTMGQEYNLRPDDGSDVMEKFSLIKYIKDEKTVFAPPTKD